MINRRRGFIVLGVIFSVLCLVVIGLTVFIVYTDNPHKLPYAISTSVCILLLYYGKDIFKAVKFRLWKRRKMAERKIIKEQKEKRRKT